MECVNIRNEGAVRIVEMDRPDALNAFNNQMMDDLADAFLDATADNKVKVVGPDRRRSRLFRGCGPQGHGQQAARTPARFTGHAGGDD